MAKKRQYNARSSLNYRYRFVKKLRHRTEKFIERAKTKEEIAAWEKVRDWISTLIDRERIIKPSGDIGLRDNLESL